MILLGEFALWVALPGLDLGRRSRLRGRAPKARGPRSLGGTVGLRGFLPALSYLPGDHPRFRGGHYEYQYVWGYSSRELETYFKVTGLWAGQRGSLVFWVLLLALFSSIAVFQNRRRNREFMPAVVGVLLTITAFFLAVLLFADVNPFERLPFTPANGQG